MMNLIKHFILFLLIIIAPQGVYGCVFDFQTITLDPIYKLLSLANKTVIYDYSKVDESNTISDRRIMSFNSHGNLESDRYQNKHMTVGGYIDEHGRYIMCTLDYINNQLNSVTSKNTQIWGSNTEPDASSVSYDLQVRTHYSIATDHDPMGRPMSIENRDDSGSVFTTYRAEYSYDTENRLIEFTLVSSPTNPESPSSEIIIQSNYSFDGRLTSFSYSNAHSTSAYSFYASYEYEGIDMIKITTDSSSTDTAVFYHNDTPSSYESVSSYEYVYNTSSGVVERTGTSTQYVNNVLDSEEVVDYQYTVTMKNNSDYDGDGVVDEIDDYPFNSDYAFDLDRDNLADEWEEDHFGTIEYDHLNDYDEDGFTNLQEYLSNTDPVVITSFAELTDTSEAKFKQGDIDLAVSNTMNYCKASPLSCGIAPVIAESESEAGDTRVFSYSINSGWNLIGGMDAIGSAAIQSFLDDHNANSVWGWDGLKWKSYIDGTPTFLNGLTSMSADKGYFVNVTSQ